MAHKWQIRSQITAKTKTTTATRKWQRVHCDSDFGSLVPRVHLRLVGFTYDSDSGSLVPRARALCSAFRGGRVG